MENLFFTLLVFVLFALALIFRGIAHKRAGCASRSGGNIAGCATCGGDETRCKK